MFNADKYILRLWCFMLVYMVANCQYNTPISPCPKIFTYENDGQQWYGKIKIQSPPYGSEMKLRVMMSLGAHLPTKYSGSIELIGERGTILNNILRGHPIYYKINFPLLHPLPKVTLITFNGRQVCSGPKETFGNGVQTVTDISLDHTLQTGNGGQRPIYDYNPDPTYNYDERPNPETFARPQPPTRPRPQETQYPVASPEPQYNYKPQKPTYNAEYDDDINKFIGSLYEQQGNQIPQQYPEQTRPSRPKRPHTTTTTTEPWYYQPETKATAPPIRQPSPTFPSPSAPSTESYECGVAPVNPLFIKGMETKKGDWPWLVAMYVKKPAGLDFTCAGTLVSHRHIITAAHCVNGKNNRALTIHDVILKVGVFNLQDEWTDDSVRQLGVTKIIAHPKYTGGLSHLDDIAIFVSVKLVEFTHYIKPACLWTMNSDLKDVVGKKGTVVGWGRDENGLTATPEPREGKVPIVSTQTCRASLAQFARLTSDTTLCAGSRDGTGPCNGDSGGGMYLNVNGIWYLRAIVSLSLPGEDMPCNLNEYVVYTDTAQYLPWIQGIMAEDP